MKIEAFGQQLQQQTSILQWLAGRLGGVEEVNNELPNNVRLPVNSLEDLHLLEQHVEGADIRSKMVRLVTFLVRPFHLERFSVSLKPDSDNWVTWWLGM